jgi:DNA-directed RNA polymerase subunit RPC12/RpoP
MFPPAFSNSSDSLSDRDFDQLIQDGIIAVKNGDRSLAKKLLEQAALINSTDGRIWIWLSATTDDLQERRTYLEHAVAVDPSNAAAKRGLLMINEKLDKTQLIPEGAAFIPQTASSPLEASLKTYTCPNCGATISFDIHDTTLVCQFCGFTRKVDQHVLSESSEQLLDAALPTQRAHRWANSQSRLTCEQCGVVIILPPGQTADSCPYCGSNRFITSPVLMELVDPQVIALFKVDPQKAEECLKTWLGKGLLSPDDLAAHQAGMQLHPAYYPFWIFEGTLEVPWFCDVNVGSSRLPQWEAHTGSQFEMFKDVLIPGVRKLSPADIAGIEPFDFNELVEFSPDFLAGWVALTYDHPLADASLRAREKVLKKVQLNLSSLVELNHPKRNFSTGAGKWSGLTYKLALLPIYIGNYPFQGKRYRIFLNGQTGKVGGKKPVDNLKLIMLSIGGLLLLAVIIAILLVLWRMLNG